MKPINIAGVEILLDVKEQYIQINDSSESDLRTAWPQIVASYPGYQIFFCYHNNKPPINFMNEINAELLDDSLEMRLLCKDISFTSSPNIVQVTEANFDNFAVYHDKCNPGPDMHWTSRRLKEDLSRWLIFISQPRGQINGYTMLSMWDPACAEIFCLEATGLADGAAIASTAITAAFEAGKSEILYMTEGKLGEEIAKELGFSHKGYYKGYRAYTNPGQPHTKGK